MRSCGGAKGGSEPELPRTPSSEYGQSPYVTAVSVRPHFTD